MHELLWFPFLIFMANILIPLVGILKWFGVIIWFTLFVLASMYL